MSCGASLPLAAKREPFAVSAPGPQQISSSAAHSYQPRRPAANQHRQQQLQPQQPHRQQQAREPQPSHQPPEAAPTNTITNVNRLANVQSKRKEKARIAARARRSQEASIIMEMAGELCINQEKLRRIDKATIVKLAIDYIRAHGVLCTGSAPAPPLCSQTKQSKNSHNNHINDQRQLSQTRHTNYGDDVDDNDQFGNQSPHQQQPLPRKRKQLATVAEPNRSESAIQQDQPQKEQPLYSAPKLSTASIFAPRTADNMNPHFLMIEEKDNGKGAFVLKPDTEILDEDDLTHLAPQAGDISISLEVEPLDGIPLEDLLIPSPVMVHQQQQLWMR